MGRASVVISTTLSGMLAGCQQACHRAGVSSVSPGKCEHRTVAVRVVGILTS
ncbi:MAG: hypothetical protein ACXQTE_04275 [Methanosarcinaceae archaeon]